MPPTTVFPAADPSQAWAPFQPNATAPWTLALAGHLFRRAGFGANWSQLQQALVDGPQATVDRLLDPGDEVEAFNAQLDRYEGAGSHESLRAWWLRRMIETPFPLLEKMTLFWHDHFSVRFTLVKDGGPMGEHVRRLRAGALGSYRKLLADSMRDPAVLLNLDGSAMRKATPGEQLARTLLERYTVGPGAFSEADVREVARSLTGWFVLRNQLRYFSREFDDGPKTVLGQTAKWNLDSIVPFLLDQPQTNLWLARRLYRWFIAEEDEPSAELLQPLARKLASGDRVKDAVEMILRSKLFFSPAAYRRKIKSPVEFAVGAAVAFENTIPTSPLGQQLAALGQDLYQPPSASGWAGGRCWLNQATLVGRDNLAAAITAAGGQFRGRLDPLAVATSHGRAQGQEVAEWLLDLILQGDVSTGIRRALTEAASGGNANETARRVAAAILALPEAQLC